MLKDLVKSCRSYRRFYEDISIPQAELTDMIDTVRLTGCTANCQPLKYRIIRTLSALPAEWIYLHRTADRNGSFLQGL